MNFVSVLMNSESDFEILNQCVEVFEKFNVRYESVILSNDKSLQEIKQNIKDTEENGAVAFVVASKIENDLSLKVASITTKPTINIPIDGNENNAILSAVQKTTGMPVGTVVSSNSSAVNVAYFVIQILALSNKELAIKLKEDRIVQSKKIQNDSFEVEVVL